MASTVEHPDIRYVVYPVHLDGALTGAAPRLRHDPDCAHFEWGDGDRLGAPVLATAKQLRTLKACKSCVETRGVAPKIDGLDGKHARTGDLCPKCYQLKPLTGICFNCDG
jgi:hypothetical protein